MNVIYNRYGFDVTAIAGANSFDGLRSMKYSTTSDADDGGALKEDGIDFT